MLCDLSLSLWFSRACSKFKADNQPISSLALSADNSTLATASAMIKMWDLASSKSQKKFTGHTSAVTSLVRIALRVCVCGGVCDGA